MAVKLPLRILMALLFLTCLYKCSLAIGTYNLGFIEEHLAPHLSQKASIVYPGSVEFNVAAERFNTYFAPNFTVAVEVATERDIVEVVSVPLF